MVSVLTLVWTVLRAEVATFTFTSIFATAHVAYSEEIFAAHTSCFALATPVRFTTTSDIFTQMADTDANKPPDGGPPRPTLPAPMSDETCSQSINEADHTFTDHALAPASVKSETAAERKAQDELHEQRSNEYLRSAHDKLQQTGDDSESGLNALNESGAAEAKAVNEDETANDEKATVIAEYEATIAALRASLEEIDEKFGA